MNWYRLSQTEQTEQLQTELLLQQLRLDLDKKYDEIYNALQTDKKIKADPYDNLARLTTLNDVDKSIEKHFARLGWKAKQI